MTESDQKWPKFQNDDFFWFGSTEFPTIGKISSNFVVTLGFRTRCYAASTHTEYIMYLLCIVVLYVIMGIG